MTTTHRGSHRINVEHAAQILGVSKRTVHNLIKGRVLTKIGETSRRGWLLDEAQVDKVKRDRGR